MNLATLGKLINFGVYSIIVRNKELKINPKPKNGTTKGKSA